MLRKDNQRLVVQLQHVEVTSGRLAPYLLKKQTTKSPRRNGFQLVS